MTPATRVRACLIAGVLLALACLAWPVLGAFAAEPDGTTRATAFELLVDDTPTPESHTFDQAHQEREEWFRFPVRSGSVYRVRTWWGSDAGVLTEVLGQDGTTVSDYLGGVEPQPSQHWIRATADGAFYVRQSRLGGSAVWSLYTMSVREMAASSIAGTVRLAPGRASASGALVSVRRADAAGSDPVATAIVDSDGAWRLEVAPGPYVVRFDDPTGLRTTDYYDGGAAVQVAEVTAVAGIDGSLALPGRATGRVCSPEGAGVGGVTVTSRGLLGDERSAVTASDGSFAIEGVDADSAQELEAGDVPGWRGAGEVLPYTVGPGATFSGALLTMHPVGRIAGTITEVLTGLPVGGVEVARMAATGGAVLGTTYTDSLGRYAFDGLSAGVSRMRFSDPDGVYVTRWVDSYDQGLSREVVVAWGAETVVDQAVSADAVSPVTSWPGWAATFRGFAPISLAATDPGGSGVASTWYSMDGGLPVSGRLASIREVGTHSVRFWSVDAAGNTETARAMSFTVLPPYVVTRVSITANHTAVTRRHRLVLHGRVYPDPLSGARVTVCMKRPGSHTWARLRSTALTARNDWSLTVTPGYRGTYYFRTRFAGNAKYAASWSATRKLTVR